MLPLYLGHPKGGSTSFCLWFEALAGGVSDLEARSNHLRSFQRYNIKIYKFTEFLVEQKITHLTAIPSLLQNLVPWMQGRVSPFKFHVARHDQILLSMHTESDQLCDTGSMAVLTKFRCFLEMRTNLFKEICPSAVVLSNSEIEAQNISAPVLHLHEIRIACCLRLEACNNSCQIC